MRTLSARPVRPGYRWRFSVAAAAAFALAGGAVTVPAVVTPQAAPAAAVVEQPDLPDVIPSLSSWENADGAFELADGARIVASAELARTAEILSDELTEFVGADVPVVTDGAEEGDVVLRVDATQGGTLGEEGYELTIGEQVEIVGAEPVGVFYGTRTIAQMFSQQPALPAGSTIDVPEFAERGLTICACQINISEQWIDRMLEEMSYLKLNYVLLELKVKSEAYPQTATWSYYTPEQIERFVAKAAERGIEVIPEINSPGHLEIWLENMPELQLTNASGEKDEVRLDITQPEAFEFLTTLIDEYLEVFTSDYWHMGADEYMITTGFQNFPQIGEYAREQWGPTATPEDAFIDFVNRINEYVKTEHGKTLRIWNDGLTGRNVTQQLDEDIVVEHWLNVAVKPQELLDAGHRVMNANYDLYLVRGGFKMNTANLYNSGWHAGVFHGGVTVDPDEPGLTGAKISLWPDSAAAQTEHSVEEEAFMPLRFIAQTTWTADYAFPTYAEFETVAREIGRPVGWDNIDRRPVEDGSYVISSTDGQVLAGTLAGGAEVGTDSSDVWSLTATEDGYYRIASQLSGQCLDVVDGQRRLGVPVGIGVEVETSPCSTSNIQKWQLLPGDDGFEVVNASTQQRLAIDESGAVVQLPPDVTGDRWILTGAIDLSVATDATRIVAGESTTVTLTATNTSDETLTDILAVADLPPGWTTDPATLTLADLAPGETGTVIFTVTAHASTLGEVTVPVTVTWNADGDEGSRDLRLKYLSVYGEPLQPVAVLDVSSEETVGENAPATNAIDGDPATFWHTQWQGATPAHPHHISVDMGETFDIYGLTYHPRIGNNAGVANGRIADYEIYVSADGEEWGEPVATGTFADSTAPKWVGFEPTEGRYVKLVALSEVSGLPFTTVGELTIDAAPVGELPTEEPTDQPTDEPTDEPTTEEPTEEPTDGPTDEPSDGPTEQPTDGPTEQPTTVPGGDEDGDDVTPPVSSPTGGSGSGDELPSTGADAAPALLGAFGLLLLGAAVLVGRRRQLV